MNRPTYPWTPKQDSLIKNCFEIMSTDKLSILMKVESSKIVTRYQYLSKIND